MPPALPRCRVRDKIAGGLCGPLPRDPHPSPSSLLPGSPATMRDVYLLIRPRALLTPGHGEISSSRDRITDGLRDPRTDIFIDRHDRRGLNLARVSPNRTRSGPAIEAAKQSPLSANAYADASHQSTPGLSTSRPVAGGRGGEGRGGVRWGGGNHEGNRYHSKYIAAKSHLPAGVGRRGEGGESAALSGHRKFVRIVRESRCAAEGRGAGAIRGVNFKNGVPAFSSSAGD